MSEDWKTYTLKEISDLIVDCPHSTPTWTKNGIVVLRSNNIRNGKLNFDNESFTDEYHYSQRVKRAVPQGGDLVITREAPMGEICMLPNGLKCCLGQRMVLIRPSLKVDNSFLLYAIQAKEVQNQIMIYEGTGSTVSNLRIPVLESLKIPFPSLSEQRSIASILSALDDKIELNLQMNKTLEEMAMTLYKHRFVDFGPFQNGEFVDSELGMIPKGWEVKRLGEILKIKHGFAFKGESFTTDENQNLLLTPGNFEMQGGIKFNWGKQKFYTGEYPSDYILKKGDLIIALTDLTQSCDILGAPALIPDEDYLYLHNQRLGLVTDLSPKLSKELVYCLANTVSFRSHIKNGKTGSTVSHTSPSRIYDYQIALPTDGISAILKEQLSELSELKFSNLSENKMLTQTRDNLLPKLISGEVRIKDAENVLAEVL